MLVTMPTPGLVVNGYNTSGKFLWGQAISLLRAAEAFLSYLTWYRNKGPRMFMKYAGMTMEERDPLVAEWANTIRVEEAPTASAPKS